MALPSSGRIKLSDVNTELGLSSTTRVSLGQATVRTLTGVVSGKIALAANGYGKANRVSLSSTFSSNTANATVSVSTLIGYIAGKTDLTITVNSGVYVYSTDTTAPGLIISNAAAGDTVTLVNNGYIMGKGGNGAGVGGQAYGTTGEVGKPGGSAIYLGCNISLTNNSYIGGGGGGGASVGRSRSGGAGGAGGGDAGDASLSYPTYLGGRGGAPGAAGTNGSNTGVPTHGGGGRIMPGVGGGQNSSGGLGGGAGGGAGPRAYNTSASPSLQFAGYSSGGSGGDAAGLAYLINYEHSCGGGGGWGAKGGDAQSGGTGSYRNLLMSGGAGGKGIELNGYSVTYVTTGTIYGAVS
jgi:hypothetical protein